MISAQKIIAIQGMYIRLISAVLIKNHYIWWGWLVMPSSDQQHEAGLRLRAALALEKLLPELPPEVLEAVSCSTRGGQCSMVKPNFWKVRISGLVCVLWWDQSWPIVKHHILWWLMVQHGATFQITSVWCHGFWPPFPRMAPGQLLQAPCLTRGVFMLGDFRMLQVVKWPSK